MVCLEDHESLAHDFCHMTEREVTDIFARFTMQGLAKASIPRK